MTPFHKTYQLERALPLIEAVLSSGKTGGDGAMTGLCRDWIANRYGVSDVMMTHSCTGALESALFSLSLEPGDEVVLPSFSYPSAANAIVLAGGIPVYAEVEPEHLNLDPDRLAIHLTPRTKAVLLVHYGGIPCQMSRIMEITEASGIPVIEDCAQSFLSSTRGRLTGTMGAFGCLSFHGTKDVVAGEGGALLINDARYAEAAHRFRNKGTNRDAYEKGLVPRYEWVGRGSSLAPSELSMALLLSQLEQASEIVSRRLRIFSRYVSFFTSRVPDGTLAGHSKPSADGEGNGHLFYLCLEEAGSAGRLIKGLSARGIDVRTHFVPLHESGYGRQFVRPNNQFHIEEGLGERLIRLPLTTQMTMAEQDEVLRIVDEELAVSSGEDVT